MRAAASGRAVTNPGNLRERQIALCEAIDRDMARLEGIAAAEERPVNGQGQALRSELARLERQHKQLEQQAAELEASGSKYLVATEPDARLMRCGVGPSLPACNLQTAVDTRHCLIIHQAVCQDGNNTLLLWPMAHASRCGLGRNCLAVVADAGYSNVAQIKACEQDGILAYVPTQRSAKSKANHPYAGAAFRYDQSSDSYVCPQGQRL